MIGDLFRSKVLVVGGLIISLAGAILLVATKIFWLSIIGAFLVPCGVTMSYNLTYIFLT